MYNSIHNRCFVRRAAILTLAGLVLATFACSSRYRLDLYLTADSERKTTEIENTELFKAADLDPNNPNNEIRAGQGNVAVIVAGRRGKKQQRSLPYALSFDQTLRVRLLVQLPSEIAPGEFQLKDNALAHLLEHYDRTPDQKRFIPVGGKYSIDSLKKSMLYMTIDGNFENADKEQISLDGEFKMRIRD